MRIYAIASIVVFWACFTLLHTPAQAQYMSAEGAYIATQYRQMPPFAHSKGGFLLGVGYLHPLRDSLLWLKTGLHYQQLDGRGQITYYNQINQPVLSFEKTQELYYLQLPLLLQWDAIHLKNITLGLQGGLSYHLLLRAWHNPQRKEVNHNVTDQFQRHVLVYQLGACVTLPVSEPLSLMAQYHFTQNLTDVQKQVAGSGFVAHVFSAGLLLKADGWRGK